MTVITEKSREYHSHSEEDWVVTGSKKNMIRGAISLTTSP
jgi:hypothetical protein